MTINRATEAGRVANTFGLAAGAPKTEEAIQVFKGFGVKKTDDYKPESTRVTYPGFDGYMSTDTYEKMALGFRALDKMLEQ